MDILELYSDIRRGDLPKLLFIHGEEDYSVDSTIAAAKKLLRFGDLNIAEYKTAFDVEDFVAKIGIPPMMDPFRLILIRKARLTYWCKEERFYGALANLPDDTRVIIHETDFLKTHEGYKMLSKAAVFVSADRFARPKMTDWIRKQFAQRGISAPADVVRSLLEMSGYFSESSGATMYDIVNAIEYLGSLRRAASTEDVENYFGLPSQQKIFELYDMLGTPRLLVLVRAMMRDGEPALKLLHMIGNFVRNIYKYKALSDEGASKSIASEMTPFIQKKTAAKSKLYSLQRLRELIEMLSDTDNDMKSTGASGEAMLENFVLELIPAAARPSEKLPKAL